MRYVTLRTTRRLERGEQVEVCSKEEGFVGSYYEATVIKQLNEVKSYVAQYKNLVEEDGITPLIEVVSGDEVRPIPPPLPVVSGLKMFDVVDAFDNDGWWVGVIGGKPEDNKYNVYFYTTGDNIAYDVSRLRIHQDWTNGNWISNKF